MSIKKISFTLVALFVLLVTSLLLVSCGGNENKKIDYSKTNGTYYRFVDEELDKNEFFTLDNGKWKDESGAGGEYTMTGTAIKFNVDLAGEKTELCSGTLSEGTLSITVGGETKVFKLDSGSIPVSDNEKLATPKIEVKIDVIDWNAVAGAQGYVLMVDGNEFEFEPTDELSYTMKDIEVKKHEITLVAKAKREKYNSDIATFTYNFDMFADGNGTKETPYGIATKEHFYNISKFPTANFAIKAKNSFEGAVFDGDTIDFYGKLTAEEDAVINNITITKSLFNLKDEASIDGVKLNNISASEISIIASNKGSIKNCSVNGQFEGSVSYTTAILVGTNDGLVENCSISGSAKGFCTAISQNNSHIVNVQAELDVEIKNEQTGRINYPTYGFVCGANYGQITSSKALGKIVFDVSYEGNSMGSSDLYLYSSIATFVGENSGEITECYSNANIEGKIYDKYDSIMIGGFVGTNVGGDDAVISKSAYDGKIDLTVDKNTCRMTIGGFVGSVNEGKIEHSLVAKEISVNCTKFEQDNYGWSASSCRYGGFVGRNVGFVSDSYAVGIDISGAEGSVNNFSNEMGDGSKSNCFDASDTDITLFEDYWFVPRTGVPVLLALADVKAIEDACDVTRNGNTLKWNAVSDADYYEYKVNGKRFFTSESNVTLEFTFNGDYEILVRPCSYTYLPGEWTLLTLSVKELTFNVESNGIVTENKFYFADGYEYTVSDLGSTRIGHTFKGWECGENKYSAGDVITVSEDMYFDGKFSVNYYNVKVFTKALDTDTGKLVWKSIYDETLAYGATISLLTPTIEGCEAAGYEFVGWGDRLDVFGAPVGEMNYTTVPDCNITAYAKFAMKSFKVTFYSNYEGATDTAEFEVEYFTDVKISNFAKPTRRGYTFVGWYKETTLETAATDFRMGASDVTLYAKWSLDVYKIDVNLSGGTADGEIPDSYTVEDEAFTLPQVTKKGHAFDGWTTNNGETLTAIDPSVVTGDITLTAAFTVNKYSLTLNTTSDGVRDGECTVTFHYGTPSTVFPKTQTITVKRGATISAPSQSSYDKTIIHGWYTKDKFDSAEGKYDEKDYFDFNSTPIYDDLDLYMDGVNIDYSQYNKYNSYSTSSSTYGSVGKNYGIICDKIDDKEGLNTQHLRAKFIVGTSVKASSSWLKDYKSDFRIVVTTKDIPGAGDYTNLKTHFKAKLINLFTNEESEFTMIRRPDNAASQGHHYYVLSVKNDKNTNYKTLTCGTAYAIEIDCLKDDYIESVYISAENPYLYNGYGNGELYAGNKEVTYGEPIGELPVLSKVGCTFDGWYLGEERVTAETMMTYDKDIALKAKFTLIKYSIEYELNGGMLQEPYPTEYDAENPIMLNYGDMQPQKDGYVFIDWYTTPDFKDGTAISNVTYRKHTGGIKIYAKFKKLNTLSFVVPDDVSAIESKKMIAGNRVTLPQPTKTGYTFNGWYTDSEFINKVDNYYVMPDSDIVLYARFTKNETTLE